MADKGWTDAPTLTIQLEDYVTPFGRHPYDQLFTDMENAREAGKSVWVTSNGIGIGHGLPDTEYDGFFSDTPWSDVNPSGPTYYKTARDCIQNRDGTTDPKASAEYRKLHPKKD